MKYVPKIKQKPDSENTTFESKIEPSFENPEDFEPQARRSSKKAIVQNSLEEKPNEEPLRT